MTPIYDGPWKLLEYTPDTGRSVWVVHQDGQMVVRVDYPVDDIIKANSEAASAASGTRWGEFARIASVPLNVFYDSGLAEANRQQDRKFIAKYLNDGDNRAWRTREGKI